MKNNYNNIFWVGGSPCAGKSTIVDSINKRYAISVMHCDDYINDHLNRINYRDYPKMYELKMKSWNDLFMAPIKDQLFDEINYYREEFQLVLEDILAVKEPNKPLIVEGSGVLPKCLSMLNIPYAKAIYILPSPEFQLYHYQKRSFKDYIMKDCINPQVAYNNWMQRDMLYANNIEQQAIACGYKTIRVTLETKPEEIFEIVITHFGIG